MKILIINKFYYPNMVGGTENSIKLLAEKLIQYGHKVYVYTLDAEMETGLLEENINGVKVVRGYSRVANEKFRNNNRKLTIQILDYIHFYFNIRALSEIKSLIKKYSIDLIHTNNCGDISYLIWNYSYRHNIPICHTLRDYWLLDPRSEIGKSNIFIVVLHRLFYRYYSNKYINYVTAPSKRTLEIFESYNYFKNSKKIRIVNAIDLDINEVKSITLEKIKRDEKKIVYLYVGALEKHKGFDLLLRAYCANRDLAGELCVCGEGSLQSFLVDAMRLDNRIVYKGKLEKDQLIGEYCRADVVVVPSIWEEPFGRVLIEGAKYANCIMCSDVGGMTEIIDNLNCGLTFKAGDKEELARVLKKFNDRELIKVLIKNINDCIDYYSIERQYSIFVELYNSIINSTREKIL